jgi:hypothetical protein
MIMAEATFNLKVNGSNKAMVAAEPSPGKTPTTVPRTVPSKQYKRLLSESEMLKPSNRLSNMPVLA